MTELGCTAEDQAHADANNVKGVLVTTITSTGMRERFVRCERHWASIGCKRDDHWGAGEIYGDLAWVRAMTTGMRERLLGKHATIPAARSHVTPSAGNPSLQA